MPTVRTTNIGHRVTVLDEDVEGTIIAAKGTRYGVVVTVEWDDGLTTEQSATWLIDLNEGSLTFELEPGQGRDLATIHQKRCTDVWCGYPNFREDGDGEGFHIDDDHGPLE